MDTMQSPAGAARNRYTESFTSRIFEPLEPRASPGLVPAGKRRDQSTAEMFGTHQDKDLLAMPKTFVPRDDVCSARQKKMHSLASEVLPHNSGGYHPSSADEPPWPQSTKGARSMGHMMPDDQEDIDPNVRRQLELSSELFGRETPAVSPEEVHDMSMRLTPTDFTWFNAPQSINPSGGQEATYKDRSYHEKCSNLFDHKSPGVYVPSDAQRQERAEGSICEAKRRANAFYSDLFGRTTPMDVPEPGTERRPKHQGPAEDQIVVHQDWTDSKTELMRGSRKSKLGTPASRKSVEFNQARIFGDQGHQYERSALEPVTTDNSDKFRGALTTQQIHQAHLCSSLAPVEFYEKAADCKHWEVIELHISGLRTDADEEAVRDLCRGFDLQIVRVSVETDPVRNLCKGRARIMLRYNPKLDSVANLVNKLRATRLTVEV